MIQFRFLHPRATEDHLGLIPEFFIESDTRPAKEQINDRYRHGGGWFDITGFTYNPDTHAIKYPGDPAMKPLAVATLHDETIYVYESGWTCVVQADGTFAVTRMD